MINVHHTSHTMQQLQKRKVESTSIMVIHRQDAQPWDDFLTDASGTTTTDMQDNENKWTLRSHWS